MRVMLRSSTVVQMMQARRARRCPMSTLLYARLPLDEREERQVRTLAHSAHAPADWVVHAQMIARSWDGWRTSAIAVERGCHMQTVRERWQAFNERGLDGLGLKPGGGRTPRITQAERSPVTPRAFPPAPGWSPNGHRIKAPLGYGRGTQKVWVYGALRVREGQELTFTAPARNTVGYLTLLTALEHANPQGELPLIADNLSRHTSGPIQQWLAVHPRG